MKISATDFKKCFDECLNCALKEPVMIEEMGQPLVVLVSYEHYSKIEDAYWGASALISDQDEALGIKASKTFLVSGK